MNHFKTAAAASLRLSEKGLQMVSNSIADYKFLKLKAIVGQGETVQLALMKKLTVSRSWLLDNSIQVFPPRSDTAEFDIIIIKLLLWT